MHLDDERIQRVLDGELDARVEAGVRRHVERCAACRAALEEAEGEQVEVDALLSRLDDPPPRVDARALVRGWDRSRRRSRFAWAASILVALGVAGGVWAAPDSLLPGWLRSSGEGSSPASIDEADRPEEAPAAGIRARADGLVVDVTAGARETELRVRLTDEALVTVRALRGDMAFTDSEEGRRLTVEPSAAGAIVGVEVPRDALRVEIRVDGRRIFVRRAGRTETEVAPGPAGVWRFRPADAGG